MRGNLRVCLLVVLFLAGVGFVKALLPVRPAVGLGVQSYSNACVVVSVTNQTRARLDYQVTVERKNAGEWPVYQNGVPVLADNGEMGALGPRQCTNLNLRVMTDAHSSPWRVSIFWWHSPRPDSVRLKVAVFLLRLHMPRLAQRVSQVRRFQVAWPAD
jgi:hypothetical protein